MYYDKEANDDNTLQGRLTELNRSLSQMMRNTSERNIVEQLHTYQLAIQKTLSVMTKKQLQTVSETSNEYEDRLERGDFS
jgi:hypothetical protein|tara:strand:- start:150 stop:389 length:240 start_codon:yes stop_codon:yes gene_type:complete